jgi:D-glycero-alpha-D-manno-heptose-7-phosphate kinase
MISREREVRPRNTRLAVRGEQVKVRIESKAPTRIDLAGGTLDIWPLYLFHDGALTVNCAITRYASCVIEVAPENSRRIVLASKDIRRKESFASFEALLRSRRYELPLLAHLVRVFRPAVGFTLTTDSEAPAGAGIGGSSALAVAICAALDRLTGAGMSREDWIHISRDVEAVVIRVPTGTQDHYPPAFGGAASIVLAAGGERREALACDADELERRLVLCYTGKPRQHGINNWEVFKRQIDGDRRVAKNLENISLIAQAMRGAVDRNQWSEAGRLMREEWKLRRRNIRTISTPLIDRVISSTRRNGALAGKVCGAGGGGCVTLLIEPDARERVEAAVAAAGAKVLPVRIDRSGVQVRADDGGFANP